MPSTKESGPTTTSITKDTHPIIDSAIAELREMREEKNYIDMPENIDVVWVLSGHGAADKTHDKGTFEGRTMDRERIDTAIELVKQITAVRVGKSLDHVTKED